MKKEIIFLKLGGSLITDKAKPSTAREGRIQQLAEEIAQFLNENPEIRLLLGHGSGSFGHVAAKKHGTRQGVDGEAGWRGFAEVWAQAANLNQLVVRALQKASLPVLVFPPSASAWAKDGAISNWDLRPVEKALAAGLLPLVYGDVAFDQERGGTVLSTEDLFVYLADKLRPQSILLAADEPVYAEYPARDKIIPEVTPRTFAGLSASMGAAGNKDVTGGMKSKVQRMLDVVETNPDCEVRIFDAKRKGELLSALRGEESPGTRIKSDKA
ncbi:MAG: uridylate kinase [Chloroflexi bacterium]|nr:isopentenyl phosphate kinase [Chloroflexota bacterium]MQC26047.1 uridylate kinase [Chloroflexota bacterium]